MLIHVANHAHFGHVAGEGGGWRADHGSECHTEKENSRFHDDLFLEGPPPCGPLVGGRVIEHGRT